MNPRERRDAERAFSSLIICTLAVRAVDALACAAPVDTLVRSLLVATKDTSRDPHDVLATWTRVMTRVLRDFSPNVVEAALDGGWDPYLQTRNSTES